MMFSGKSRVWLPLVFAAGLLAACGPNATLLSEADEARIGAEEHGKIMKAYGGAYGDERVNDYVEAIMEKIARASDKPDQQFQITVLNSPVVNAFACPAAIHMSRAGFSRWQIQRPNSPALSAMKLAM